MSCGCVICGNDLEAVDPAVAERVREHGWSVVGVREEPGWAFTVGLHHTFGRPELAMFGLPVEDLQWLLDELASGAEVGLPLDQQPVDESWRGLFGWLDAFYRAPVPVVQAVWPDADGLQPHLWIPREQHPPSMWLHLPALTPWPYEATPSAPVATLQRVLAGNEVCGVVHDHDGHWQFLDGGPITDEDVALVPLARVLGEQPQVMAFADLPPGHQAWLQADASWERTPL